MKELPRDKHLRVLSAIIAVVAAPLILLLLLSPLALARVVITPTAFSDDDRLMSYIVLPITFALGLYGVFLAVTAMRLWKRQTRAGWWALVACVTWMPTGLMPFGVYGLYALLRSKQVRDAWV